MDNKTRMNDVCIMTLNTCNSNKDNGSSNDVANGNPQWVINYVNGNNFSFTNVVL